jgi:hypothetical protein
MSDLPETPFETVDEQHDDTSADPDAGPIPEPSGGPIDRLFDADAPGPSVDELRGEYQMPRWAAIVSRGVMRVATGSGVPPVAEIIIGAVMGLMGSDMPLSIDSDADTNDEPTGGAPPGVEL